jgi:multiple antibiotic resistance protein
MTTLLMAVNVFVSLFALIDPIGNIPVFAAATGGASPAQRRRLALYLSIFIVAFLAFFYVSGLWILQFFGISLPAFRIAGGILLFLLGLKMTSSDFLTAFADAGEETNAVGADVRAYARRRFERLIVPFAMPLLIGPGAISAIIIQAGDAARIGLNAQAAGIAAIVATGVATFLAFASTGVISRVLGRVGMAIVVRVLGLVLCALAVQFIIAGVGETIPGLVSDEVSRPYHS